MRFCKNITTEGDDLTEQAAGPPYRPLLKLCGWIALEKQHVDIGLVYSRRDHDRLMAVIQLVDPANACSIPY